MVATDLVQVCVYWDTHSGVEGISTLLAKVRVKIGNSRFWDKAAVLDNFY